MKRLLFSLPAFLLCVLLPPVSPARAKSASDNLDLARQLDQAFIDVAAKLSPDVVVINVVEKAAPPSDDSTNDDSSFEGMPPGFWRRFHDQFRHPEQRQGKGSGVVIRDDGYILTNSHVVDNAETIDVHFQDGRVLRGTVRGVDSQSDLAVIKVDAHGLPTAKLADSSQVRVGEFAIAIGAPFSLDYSVTFGHVSAKGRSKVIEGPEAASMDQDFIQTDALINPGNSGGPLVNIDGEVIGINTLIEGLHTGIGFAIPSNLAREVSDQLISQGKFSRPWLGIAIQGLREDPDLRDLIKGVDDGVVVSRVLPDGPAAKSDLKPSDVILSVEGNRVSTPQQLRNAIRGKKIGQPVTLEVFRKDKTLQVKVSPSEWVQPVAAIAKVNSTRDPETQPVALGIAVEPLTKELAAQFGIDLTEGVVVASVDKNSPAARKGLKPGDLITSINQQETHSPKQFREVLKRVDLKKGVLINLVSGSTARFEILKAE
jgi:serine protease Do